MYIVLGQPLGDKILMSIEIPQPWAGADNILWTNFDDNRKAFSLCPYVASVKVISSKSDFIHIFNDFIHVYSPRARAYNPLGTNFWCQWKALITLPIHCKFKKRNLILYTFLMILYMYTALGQGQTTPWGQTFDVNRKPLSLCPFVAGFKKKIYIFFMFHHMYIAPGRGKQSIGDKFWWQQKGLFSLPLCCKFQMISLKYDFIHILNDFIHVHSLGAREENPLGTNYWCQQEALTTLTTCCKFQTNLFEFWFYTHFLMFFHMYTAPGQGQTTVCGQNPDVNIKALSLCPFVASFNENIFEVRFYT